MPRNDLDSFPRSSPSRHRRGPGRPVQRCHALAEEHLCPALIMTSRVWLEPPFRWRLPGARFPAMASGVDRGALRRARERVGLTQHELARLVGVAGGERISRWELGTSEPRPELLKRVAEVLDIPLSDLVRLERGRPDLRGLRFLAGLSATALADCAHVTVSTYLRWESGRWQRLPAAGTLEALAKALQASPRSVTAAFEEAKAVPERR